MRVVHLDMHLDTHSEIHLDMHLDMHPDTHLHMHLDTHLDTHLHTHLEDVTSRSRPWRILYTEKNISTSSQQQPQSRAHWTTIGNQQHASYNIIRLNFHPSQRHIHNRPPLHRKCVQAVGDYPVPTSWCRGHAPLDRHKYWQAKHIKSNREADTESHTAAQLSANGCPPILPMNLGNIWLLYDAHTPSFPPRGSVHWNHPPWSLGVHPSPRDAIFNTHKDQHKGKLYPLYTQGC